MTITLLALAVIARIVTQKYLKSATADALRGAQIKATLDAFEFHRAQADRLEQAGLTLSRDGVLKKNKGGAR